MNLFGLAPSTLLLLAGSLAGSVLALHLLRIRLRQVEVDTLLFLRMAGAVRQPRVLLGSPSRWLALLLALVAGFAGLLAIADPRSGFERPSRIVVVEPAPGAEGEARLAMARDFAEQHGIGPRGMVLAATADPAVLLRADEPPAAVRVLPGAVSGAAGAAAAWAAAARLLREGDEIVWIGASGAPAPEVAGGIRVRSLRAPGQVLGALQGVVWRRGEDGRFVLVVQCCGASGARLVLRAGDTELAAAAIAHELAEVELGPFLASGRVTLALEAGDRAHRVELAVPAAEPCRVHLDDSLQGPAATALRALLAVDAEFALEADPAQAQVVVAAVDAEDARPRLVVHEGAGAGPRLAHLTEASPVALSLRDRQLREAPALPELPGATAWVEDLTQRAVLAAAGAANERLRVHLVRWLLEPETHGDVPLLLRAALCHLANRPEPIVAFVGVPLAVPAGLAPASGELAEHGALRTVPQQAGAMTLGLAGGPLALQVAEPTAAALVAPAAPEPDGDAATEANEGATALAPWLLALLLLALALDALWFHRGRMP